MNAGLDPDIEHGLWQLAQACLSASGKIVLTILKRSMKSLKRDIY